MNYLFFCSELRNVGYVCLIIQKNAAKKEVTEIIILKKVFLS